MKHQDFESYYTDVSAATPSDDFFSLQVQACWGLGPAAASCAVSTSIVHPAAATAAAGENYMRHSGDYDPAYTRRTYSKARTSAPPGVLPGTAERSTKARATGRAGSRSAGRTPTAGVAAILRKLGAEVQGHGAAWGLAGLRRALFDADRCVSKQHSVEQTTVFMTRSGLRLGVGGGEARRRAWSWKLYSRVTTNLLYSVTPKQRSRGQALVLCRGAKTGLFGCSVWTQFH